MLMLHDKGQLLHIPKPPLPSRERLLLGALMRVNFARAEKVAGDCGRVRDNYSRKLKGEKHP